MDIHKLYIHLDTSDVHNALDDVLDHVSEVNEALGIYASGALDCDCDECLEPQVGDIVQLASGSPDMTVTSLLSNARVRLCWYDSVDSFDFKYAELPIEVLTLAD